MHNNEIYYDSEKWMDDALKSEPNFVLKADFADKMAEKMCLKFAWRQYFLEFAIYAGGILSVVAIFVMVHVFLAETDLKSLIRFISANLSLVTIGAILVLFVLFADRVLLRYFMYRSKIDSK